MSNVLHAVVRRDLLLAWRRRSDVATTVLFFVIVRPSGSQERHCPGSVLQGEQRSAERERADVLTKAKSVTNSGSKVDAGIHP